MAVSVCSVPSMACTLGFRVLRCIYRPGRGKEGEYWSAGLTSTTLWQADFSLLFEWAAELSVQHKQKKTTTIGCLGKP